MTVTDRAVTNPTRRLADWIAGAGAEVLRPDVVSIAKRHIVDTVGVALAGSASPATRAVARHAFAHDVGGAATALGHGHGRGAQAAALVNGVSAHALDFDDQSYSELGHASTVVLPAALALVEDLGLPGRALVGAYVVGMEVTGKLGQAMNPSLFRRGWHTTGVLGALGAAGAAAHLYGLDAERVADALGLAAVRAGGLRANNGSLAKAYQAGQAAQAGIVSAQLARCGLTASPDVLGARDGFDQLANAGEMTTAPLRTLGDPLDLVDPGIMIKRYPACSALATALDALFALRDTTDLAPDRIERIHHRTTPLAVDSVPIVVPQTPYQGKFSAPFCLAAAVVTGRVDRETFDEPTLRDPRVRALMDKVEISADPTGGWAPADGPEAATIRVVLTDGRQVEHRCTNPRGSPAAPLPDDELDAKFLDGAGPVLGPARAASLLSVLRDLENQPGRALTASVS